MSAIYFARVGEFVKIGFSSNPRGRMKSLLTGGRLILPEGIDLAATPELILVVPFCRMRDERNMQLLFARHWVVGEWFRWSPEFAHQMQTMQFVTEAVRKKHMRKARADLGATGTAHYKPERWGKQTHELLAELNASP